jgi:hypothetical protein
MHSVLYAKVDNGQIDFLITEKEAKLKLMETKIG